MQQASYLEGGPTDVDVAPVPALESKSDYDDDDDMMDIWDIGKQCRKVPLSV